jgi:hypothetical protein
MRLTAASLHKEMQRFASDSVEHFAPQLVGVPTREQIGIAIENRRAVVACHVWEGSNGYAGARALSRLGWETSIANEFAWIPLQWRTRRARAVGRAVRPMAVQEFGKHIVQLCSEIDATLFLAFKGTFVPAAGIRELRSQGVLTICHYPDVSTTVHGPWLRNNLREYDWVFTAKTFGLQDMARENGVSRSSVLLHGFDPEVHHPFPASMIDRSRYGADVSFIGTWSPEKERRLAALLERIPKMRLRIWGAQWEKCADARLSSCLELHPVMGRSYAAAIQATTINLALLSERRPGASQADQVTSRTFHLPAVGGLMIHERTGPFLRLFRDGEEALSFADDDELADIVRRVLEGRIDVCKIRKAGTIRVWGRDSWDHRIGTMLQHEVFDRLRISGNPNF